MMIEWVKEIEKVKGEKSGGGLPANVDQAHKI